MKQNRKQPARRGSAVWAVIITSLAGFITALDNLIVTTALPSIREDSPPAPPRNRWPAAGLLALSAGMRYPCPAPCPGLFGRTFYRWFPDGEA